MVTIPKTVPMTLKRFRQVYPEWLRWMATERRFLPVRGGMRDQPSGLMDDLLFLDGLLQSLTELNRQQNEK